MTRLRVQKPVWYHAIGADVGKVFIVNSEYQADKNVFIVNSEYQADRKVFVVTSEYQAT